MLTSSWPATPWGLLPPTTMDAVQSIGTGSLRKHFDAVAAGGGRVYASGMSTKARGLDAESLGGSQVEFAPPDRLVDLAFEADRVISY